MRAIILAAGVGSRLRPITDKKPKTMVKVNGKPMISYIIDAIVSAGINEVVVCTGYRAEQLESYILNEYTNKLKVIFVNNTAYETTNNMYSLYLARDYLNGEIMLMNADLVFDETIIHNLAEVKGCVVAVDKGVYQDESMKLVVGADGLIQNISKQIAPEDSFGCSIDVYKFDTQSVQVIKHEIKKIIEVEEDLNQWTEVLLDRVFSEQLVHGKPFDIEGRKWFEIDNYEDLAKAETLFSTSLALLSEKKAFILDKDGTLTIGKTRIEGAEEFLAKLDDKNKKWVVGSNNSSKTSIEHSAGLRDVFSSVNSIEVISSLDVSIKYLKEKGVMSLFWVANTSVSEELRKSFNYDCSNPDAILLTYDNEVDYGKLLQLIGLIRKNIPYYATHIDMVCPTEEGDIPDIGSLIEVVYSSTNVRPIKSFGKPTKAYLYYVLESMGVNPDEAVLVGDRLYTDIAACENEDVTSVLVLSGETSRSKYEEALVKADIIIPSLRELEGYV